MKNFTFNSQIQIGDRMSAFSQEQIKNEPMFFSCDAEFVAQHGGPISRDFLTHLSGEFLLASYDKNLIIDSRVHMLMKGWFPCIPGYHHDDVPRGKNGQPDYYTTEYFAKHAFALQNAGVAPTEFALGQAEFPDVEKGELYYKIWHPIVEEKIKSGKLQKFDAPDRDLIYFDWQTWHQGIRAVDNGWRWFMRATINTKREVKNEIRRQVNVYLENPMEGW